MYIYIYISDKGLVSGKQKETFYLNIKINLLKMDKTFGQTFHKDKDVMRRYSKSETLGKC